MSVADNITFLNTLILTDPSMMELSKNGLKRLSKCDNLMKEFRSIYKSYPFLNNIQILRLAYIKINRNKQIMDTFRLVETIERTFNTCGSFDKWLRVSCTKAIDLIDRDYVKPWYDIVKMYLPPDTIAVDLGDISLNIANGWIGIYEKGKYIGRTVEWPEITVEDNLIKIKAGTLGSEFTYHISNGVGGFHVDKRLNSTPWGATKNFAKYRGYITCNMNIWKQME